MKATILGRPDTNEKNQHHGVTPAQSLSKSVTRINSIAEGYMFLCCNLSRGRDGTTTIVQ